MPTIKRRNEMESGERKGSKQESHQAKRKLYRDSKRKENRRTEGKNISRRRKKGRSMSDGFKQDYAANKKLFLRTNALGSSMKYSSKFFKTHIYTSRIAFAVRNVQHSCPLSLPHTPESRASSLPKGHKVRFQPCRCAPGVCPLEPNLGPAR